MVRSREEAVKLANATERNTPGTCQYQVRTWLDAPSAGDQDGDGDADAVDGWASEPLGARHTDRNPPGGTPCAWSGGSLGHGHRALANSDGTVTIRSTDAAGEGHCATVPLDWPEKHWGLHWLGWSETIDGEPIPYSADPARPHVKHTPPRLTKVTRAQRLTERAMIRAQAKGQTTRATALRLALTQLRRAGR